MGNYVTHLRIQTTDPDHAITVEIDTVPEEHFEDVILNGPEPFIKVRDRGSALWISKQAIESVRPVAAGEARTSPFTAVAWPAGHPSSAA